ncbi:MAG: hydrolase TatD [Bacteroidetes bacterium HGW-Bacteroidetes-12]|jgi:TatD DNase family protein|nr:MAG: hydrolase TatD [Bacteroidetes bacterium HGW-Bacteroidetes-12]
MILTDTHTHLYSEQFDNDIDEVIANAIKNGVTRFFLPNIDASYTEKMLQLAEKYPQQLFPMMGLHPCSVKENYKEEIAHVEQWLEKYPFCAIGEIGIDLYWDKSFLSQQQEAFRLQIALAKKYDLPFVIHCRDAFNEIFEIMDELNDDKMRGIFHCFTGDLTQANHIINYGGFKLGIGGVVTFKNSGLDKVVEHVDMQHIVLETDAPYLAPVPFRGKRNESAYLLNIAQKVAEIKGLTIVEVAEITTQNSVEVFGM